MPTLTDLQPNTRIELPSSPAKIWTEDELLALPDDDGKYELVNGELILMSPAGGLHGRHTGRLFSRLAVFVEDHKLGECYDGQTGFWMKSGNLRAPDISFVSKQRLEECGGPTERFFHIAPELAVEVISPNERRKKIEEKLVDYFESGTLLVWFVFSRSRTVRVYRDAKSSTLPGEHEVLSGEEVVPGFSFPIQRLFEGMQTEPSQ